MVSSSAVIISVVLSMTEGVRRAGSVVGSPDVWLVAVTSFSRPVFTADVGASSFVSQLLPV